MKLLFDENISHKLPVLVEGSYPDSSHVRDCHLTGSPDELIWKYANDHGYVVVSKDSDFHGRALLLGAPPKVIWLRIGNCTTNQIKELLEEHQEDVSNFGKSDAAILTLG